VFLTPSSPQLKTFQPSPCLILADGLPDGACQRLVHCAVDEGLLQGTSHQVGVIAIHKPLVFLVVLGTVRAVLSDTPVRAVQSEIKEFQALHLGETSVYISLGYTGLVALNWDGKLFWYRAPSVNLKKAFLSELYGDFSLNASIEIVAIGFLERT
jgi:hypothetical protein